MRFFQYSTSSLFLVSPILFSCGNAVDNQRKTDKPEVKIVTVTDENKQKTIDQIIKELREKIENYLHEIKELKSKLSENGIIVIEKQEAIDSLKTQLKQEQDKVSGLENKLKQEQDKVSGLENKLKQEQDKVSGLETELKQEQGKVGPLESESDKRNLDEINRKKKEVNDLNAELSHYKELLRLEPIESCRSKNENSFNNTDENFREISNDPKFKSISEIYLGTCLNSIINDPSNHSNKDLLITLKTKNNIEKLDFISLSILDQIGNSGYRLNYRDKFYSSINLSSENNFATLSESGEYPENILFSKEINTLTLRITPTRKNENNIRVHYSFAYSDKYNIKIKKYYPINKEYTEIDLCIYSKTKDNYLNKYCFSKLKINNK